MTDISEDQLSTMLHLLSTISKTEHEVPINGSTNVAGTCLIICSNSQWIIDSEATDHICNNLILFRSYEKYNKFPNTITIADEKQVIVENIGRVEFDDEIVLERVLRVLGFKFHFLSTHKLLHRNELSYHIHF